MRPDIQLLETFFEMGERQYGENWAQEATQWNQRAVYEKVAALLPLKDGGTHLDIGSGWGHLLGHLHLRSVVEKKSMNLLGIDINPFLAVNALHYLNEHNIPTNLCYGTGIAHGEIDGKVRVWREFVGPEDRGDWEKLLASNTVSIIVDDVRQANVLQELLGERKLSSATFLFPGTGAYLAYAAPFNAERLTSDQERERIIQYMGQMREKAYSLMASCMERDGCVIAAERISKMKGMSDKDVLEDAQISIIKRMGSSRAAWNMEELYLSAGRNIGISSPMEWMTRDEKGSLQSRSDMEKEGNGYGVIIAKLRRNRFTVRG